jgi:hypothetical protein
MAEARTRPGIRARLRGPRALAGAWLALLVASSIWFFAGTDAVGGTARLSADAAYYHAYLPSLVLDRDLDLANQYALTRNWYGFGRTELGRPANIFGIGPAVFELPAFVAGHAVAWASGLRASGFSRPEVAASLYMSLLATLGALVPASRLLRRRLGGGVAPIAAPLLVAAAGPVVYYAIRQPGYAHPFATFFTAWLVERWDASWDGGAAPRSLRTWSLLGLLIGAAALARPQCALWAILLVVAAADDVRRARVDGSARAWLRASLRPAARWMAGAALALLVFAPQMLAWKALYGAFVVTPQGPGFMWWGEPAWSEVLFSSRNGLLPWAPLLALAGAGLFASGLRTPRIGIALLAGVALQVLVNGAVWDWWAGGSFGGRRFDSTYIAFAYGLGAVIAWPSLSGGRARAAQAAVAAALVLSILLAAANLQLASRASGPVVRVLGGEPASRVLGRVIPGPLAPLAAAASSAANFPARVLFAWRHGASLGAYDRVVGVHQLGELYPGLNTVKAETQQAIALDAASEALLGARPGPLPGSVEMIGASARVLVGLNRRDPIAFTVRASSPAATGALELLLDGEPLARGQLSPAPTPITGTAPRARRGVNVLEIRAAPGTLLHSLELRATRDPRGRVRDTR